MGGLLVVSRLLAEPAAGERLEPVERRLFGSFIHGGAALVIASGILLILDQPSVLRQGWLHAKLLVVLGLVAADARLYRRMQAQHARGEVPDIYPYKAARRLRRGAVPARADGPPPEEPSR